MALVTATEAATLLPTVSRHLIGMWRHGGKLAPKSKRGRSPLYDWADICRVEAATRTSTHSRRKPRTA